MCNKMTASVCLSLAIAYILLHFRLSFRGTSHAICRQVCSLGFGSWSERFCTSTFQSSRLSALPIHNRIWLLNLFVLGFEETQCLSIVIVKSCAKNMILRWSMSCGNHCI